MSASTRSRLLPFVRPDLGRLALAGGASLITAAATAAYSYILGPLLRALLTSQPVRVADWEFSGRDLFVRLPLALVGVVALKASAQFLQNGSMQTVSQRAVTRLRRALYQKLLAVSPQFLDARHSGELLSRFTADVAQVELAASQALSSFLRDSLQVLALLATCWVLDRRLFALAFIVLPAAVIPVSRFARSVKRVAVRTQASLGRLTELAAESVHNLPVVQAYGYAPFALARFDGEQRVYLSGMRRSLFIRGAFTPTLEVLGICGVAAAVGFGARAVAAEPELAGKLLSFLAAALLLYQPLKALSGAFGLAVQGLGAADRLFEIADAPAPKDEGTPAEPLRRELSLRDVRVSYGPGFEALRGLDLTVPAGKTVAVVGASGAGKTTLFSALLGFVGTSAGEIRWDDAELGALQPSSVRRQMAWVPQEPVLFSGSVRENLLFGTPDATEPELWEALRRAHAEDFVRAFPQGLEEPVGERGGRLSGGQRQRLAIARALLRAPSLLLLDEPTSALDAASEREVQAGLSELMHGRTTLVIAHRLSTVRNADYLYVLDDGRVVEEGQPAQLQVAGGRFASLLLAC